MFIKLFIAYMILMPVYLLILALYIKKDGTYEPKRMKTDRNTKRDHAKLAKLSLSTPLSPYELYKDKNTNLYVPRKIGGGVKIEDWHNK